MTDMLPGPKQPAISAPMPVTVMRGEEVEQLGIRSFSDLLRRVPGVEVTRTSSTESNVSTRGYNDVPSSAQGMLAMIDRRVVYNPFFGNVFWDALPVAMSEIEQIEVLRGPGSFAFGPNSKDGLVSIVTKSPLDYDGGLSLTSRVGSYGSSATTFTQVLKKEDSGLKTTLAWDTIDQFEDSPVRVGDKRFLELRYAKVLGEDTGFELTGGVSELNQDVLIPTVLDAIPMTNFALYSRETFVKANYSTEKLKAQLYWTGWDSSAEPLEYYDPFSVDLDTFDFDLQYSFSLGTSQTATWGTGYRLETFKTLDNDVSNGRHDTRLVWGFFQDTIEVGSDWTVTAGARLDEHSPAGLTLSPRVAAVWEFMASQFFRFSVGYGFRNPSLRELWFNLPVRDTVPPPNFLTIHGNKDLVAEEIRSFELGYTGLHLGKSLRLGANFYYNRIDDLIQFETVTSPSVGATPFNEEDEEAFGAELELDYQFSKMLSGFANYSIGRRQDRETETRNPIAPRHKGNIGARYVPKGRDGMQVSLWATYFGEVEFDDNPVDAYSLLSGRISFPVGGTHARIFLEAFNLLDNDHLEHPEGQSYGRIMHFGFSASW